MMEPDIQQEPCGARRVSQVILLLDARAHILSVNSGLAGSTFTVLRADNKAGLHEQLHGDCSADCRFNDMWRKAWQCLSSTDGVEWEVDDPVLGRLLRMNLAKPPAAESVAVDRRRGHALLTLTDITKHRREYESLVKRERALMKIVQDKGEDPEASANDDVALPSGSMLGRQLILAQELERKRIASELHDGIAQAAGVIKYNVEASIETLSRADASLDLSLLENVVDQTRALLEEVRRISTNLGPSMLDDFGLCVALQWLCDEFRSETCDYRPSCSTCLDESRLPHVVKVAAYRVVQEALNNISKHAEATEVTIDVTMSGDDLLLEVADNGVGFAPEAGGDKDFGSGAGLGNMRERVEATGGEFAVDAATGGGTVIRAAWKNAGVELLGDEPVLNGVDGHG